LLRKIHNQEVEKNKGPDSGIIGIASYKRKEKRLEFLEKET